MSDEAHRTEFDKDDQSTLAAYLVTSHGRATPLVWKTVRKSKLKNHRNEHEYQVIRRLHELLPMGSSPDRRPLFRSWLVAVDAASSEVVGSVDRAR